MDAAESPDASTSGASELADYLVECARKGSRVESQRVDSILQRVSQLNFVRLEPAAIAELLHTLTVAIQRLAAENQRPHHAPVMDIIEKASKELEPGGFPPATLAHILWTWATLQQRPSMVTSRRVCTAVAASIGSMTPEQISTVAWCLGAQDVRAKSDLADALCKDVFSRIWAFSMDHLRYVAWAFRSLAYAPPPAIWRVLEEGAEAFATRWTSKTICAALWLSAELGYQLPSPAMSALRREIASRLSDFTHEEMVVVLKAWAKVGYRDGGSAVRYCITELAEAAVELPPDILADAFLSSAELMAQSRQAVDRSTLQRFEDAVLVACSRVDASQVTKILRAFTVIKYTPSQGVLRFLERQFTAKMSDASPSDVAGVVDSYCRNSYAGSPEFVTALDGELSGDLAERMGVRDICKVALGAARLGWELSGEAMDMMDARLESLILANAPVAPLDAAQLLWAFARIGYGLSDTVVKLLETVATDHLKLVDSSSVIAGSIPTESSEIVKLLADARGGVGNGTGEGARAGGGEVRAGPAGVAAAASQMLLTGAFAWRTSDHASASSLDTSYRENSTGYYNNNNSYSSYSGNGKGSGYGGNTMGGGGNIGNSNSNSPGNNGTASLRQVSRRGEGFGFVSPRASASSLQLQAAVAMASQNARGGFSRMSSNATFTSDGSSPLAARRASRRHPGTQSVDLNDSNYGNNNGANGNYHNPATVVPVNKRSSSSNPVSRMTSLDKHGGKGAGSPGSAASSPSAASLPPATATPRAKRLSDQLIAASDATYRGSRRVSKGSTPALSPLGARRDSLDSPAFAVRSDDDATAPRLAPRHSRQGSYGQQLPYSSAIET